MNKMNYRMNNDRQTDSGQAASSLQENNMQYFESLEKNIRMGWWYVSVCMRQGYRYMKSKQFKIRLEILGCQVG